MACVGVGVCVSVGVGVCCVCMLNFGDCGWCRCVTCVCRLGWPLAVFFLRSCRKNLVGGTKNRKIGRFSCSFYSKIGLKCRRTHFFSNAIPVLEFCDTALSDSILRIPLVGLECRWTDNHSKAYEFHNLFRKF